MSNSKSCLNCGVLLESISPVSICPSCLRSTPGPADGPTLAEVIRDLAPTADYAADKPTADYASPDGDPTADIAPAPQAPESAAFSSWEQSKVLELAARGYRVACKIGEGGFGVVFRAVDAAGRTVAIKMLHAGLGHERHRQRFALEANALTRLDDPGLVRLFHYDVSGPEPMLVTEFVPGGTLAQKLHGRAVYGPHAAAEAVRQLATSVQVVHDAGLIHRDIKPSNILLGADGHLKLGDFGLAKRLDREDDLTPTGRGIGGTPEYSAPEQFRASGDCDGRADIYALGATLYRLLTGKPVFERAGPDDLVGVILRVLGEEPVPPRKLNPEIPRGLEAICLKCLAKNPTDRYASAGALAADLKAWQAGERPVVRPSTVAARAWKALRRVPKLPAAMVLMALFGLGAAFVILDEPAEPLVAMKRQMAKEGRLQLQGEKGRPRWHNFPIGGPELSDSLIGDKACSFESLGVCVLELYPEAPSNHFLMRVDLRFAESRIGADPAVRPFIGAFVAGQRAEDPADPTIAVYTMSALYYEERPAVADQQNLRFSAFRLAQRPEALPSQGKSGLAHLPFTPSAALPGPWRTFEIEVWLDGVVPRTVSRDAAGTATVQDFTIGAKGGRLDRDTIQPLLDKQEERLRSNRAYANLPYPKWNPRGAVGLWGYKAAVDFKNVSLTPLP